MLNSDVLVLNAGFIPVRISNVREAIGLIFSEKAYPVVEEDKYIRSPRISIRVPSVIALIKYGEFPVRKVAYSRLNVIYRDDQVCQYCGKQFSIRDLTVDHLIPRSRWIKRRTPTHWENVVCACKRCNALKGNKLISELGWTILKQPKEPKYLPHMIISFERAEAHGWIPYCNMNVRLVRSIHT